MAVGPSLCGLISVLNILKCKNLLLSNYVELPSESVLLPQVSDNISSPLKLGGLFIPLPFILFFTEF